MLRNGDDYDYDGVGEFSQMFLDLLYPSHPDLCFYRMDGHNLNFTLFAVVSVGP